MVFSGIPFLFYFLPAVLVLYYLTPAKYRNYILLLSSLVFYFYGGQLLVLLMLFTALWNWLCGKLIAKARNKKIVLGFSVFTDIAILGYFKYANFFIDTFNTITGLDSPLIGITLPLGISFYIFQAVSYVVDVYRNETKAENNPITFTTYLTLFPQLIAGPIIRYSDLSAQLRFRTTSFSLFSDGVTRFVTGLGKKVIIANTVGEFCNDYLSIPETSALLAWMYAVCFTLQIYFDFSGYCDMAIGIGKMLGFTFPENFNYPYVSKSIREFWKRWHITLGEWFRDYIYIPLGGNRCSITRHIMNLLIVWLLTGFWHGADWNYVIWGLWYGLFIILETFMLKKYLNKLPGIFGNIYTMLIVIIGFVIFSCNDNLGGLHDGFNLIRNMFGGTSLVSPLTWYYIKNYGLITVIAIIGSTPLPVKITAWIKNRLPQINYIYPLWILLILVWCICELSDSTFNPFLYFQF